MLRFYMAADVVLVASLQLDDSKLRLGRQQERGAPPGDLRVYGL